MDDRKLLDKALEWYQHHNLRDAALDLFPEETLQAELKAYNKRKAKERHEAREKELKNVLEQCKKQFPIGTIMWSDEGSDHCPNIVISEPYIGKSDWHIPYGVYGYGERDTKTVLAETVRISRNKPFQKDYIGLEICLRDMLRDDNLKRNRIINLDEFHKQEIEKRDSELSELQKNANRIKKDLQKYQEDILSLKVYNPLELTQEYIQEIVKQYT